MSAPPALLPYQARWVEDPSPLKVIEKSRRTGITWAEASDDVLIAAVDGGQNVYYIGYNQDMAIEYVEACGEWARAFNRAASAIEVGFWTDGEEDRQIKTFTIRFPSGSRIVALSSRPANLRGKQGIVVIDEAAWHTELGELLKAAMALLIWGGKVRVISTHNGDNNPFNALVQEIRSGRRSGTVHRVTFEDAVTQGLCRRVYLRTGRDWSRAAQTEWVQSVLDFYGDDAAEELGVIPAHGSGSFLTRVLIESRMRGGQMIRLSEPDAFTLRPSRERSAEIADWLEYAVRPAVDALDPGREHAWGEDFGRSGDLSVIAVYEITAQLMRRVPIIIELRRMPFEQQRQILFWLGDALPRFAGAGMDARGNGQQLAEEVADRYGHGRIDQVMLSDRWYAEHMPRFRAAFEDGTIELVRDSEVLEDLRMLRVEDGVPKLPKTRRGRRGEQRHGDAAIALALGYAATLRERGPIEFRSAGRRASLGEVDFAPDLSRGFGTLGPRLDWGGY